jgi:4-hydroxymandelate oxidase
VSLPFAEAAAAALGAPLYRYLLGAAHDVAEGVPDANEAAFARYRLLPRVLRGGGGIDIRAGLFGRLHAGPLAVGPFAGDRLFHAEGLLPVARVCQRLSLPLMVSEETVTPLADIAAAHDACWLQLRAAGPRDRVLRLADAAARLGLRGVVLTVLAPAHPVPGLQPGGYAVGEEIARSGWTTVGSEDGSGVAHLAAWPQWSWSDVAAIAAHLAASGLALLVKGVLRPEDAAEAAAAGCGGVIAANVGLRQSGRWALPLDLLGELRARATGHLLLDGGVRHGADVVIACCLGADFAVAVRPVVAALAAGGEAAVTALLGGWLDEVTAIASWLGVERLAELDPSYLRREPA